MVMERSIFALWVVFAFGLRREASDNGMASVAGDVAGDRRDDFGVGALRIAYGKAAATAAWSHRFWSHRVECFDL